MEIEDRVATIYARDAIDLESLANELVDTVHLELIRPKEFGGKQVEWLTFEEPTGSDVEKMSKVQPHKAVETSFEILGGCTGLAPKEVKQLGSRDLTRLGQVLRHFLPESPLGAS